MGRDRQTGNGRDRVIPACIRDTNTVSLARLRGAIWLLLDQVDYTRKKCLPVEPVCAVLPLEVIRRAQEAACAQDPNPREPLIDYAEYNHLDIQSVRLAVMREVDTEEETLP